MGETEESVFQQLNTLLVEAPVFTYPPTSLDTDASNEAAGAVLLQMVNAKERVVAYYSKLFSPLQRNYCLTKRELLAVVLPVSHFRPYLYSTECRPKTNHVSLIWLCTRTKPYHQVAK